jgi:hypothetical protein
VISVPDPELHYLEDGCFRYTFDAPKVKQAVESLCARAGKTVNLFAGKNHLHGVDEIRVDSSDEFHPDYNWRATSFLNMARFHHWQFPRIIWDPPWNERKAKEFYNGRYIGRFTRLKDKTVSILSPGGRIISLGNEISNFGEGRGMFLEHVYIINPKGEIRPYIISVERKMNRSLDEWKAKVASE